MSRLRRALCASFFMIAAAPPGGALAQSGVDVVLFVNPYPSPYVADWEVQAGNLSLNLTNDAQERDVVVLLTLREAGGPVILEAESDPIYFGANETLVFNSVSEVGGSIDYDSSYGEGILRSGRLPEGEFEICVRVTDAAGQPVAADQCAPFTILFPDPAYLVAPFDGDTVRTTNPVFQWTPLQVPVGQDFSFLLQIAEILPGQSPWEALTSNVLHYEAEDLVIESFQYPIDAPPLEEGTTYAWWVQALDPDGLAVTANLGRSEIWTFGYADDEIELFPSGDPQSLRLVQADQASGALVDYDASTFEQVVDGLNASIEAGVAIEIPLAMPQDFPPIDVAGVTVYVDTQTRSLAIRGQKVVRGKSYDILFTTHWGSRHDPRSKALSIKGPRFEGFFPAGGWLDELATSQAWLVIACGPDKLRSDDLPPEVKDYFGDEEIGVKLGLNFYCKSVIADTGWLRDLTGFMGNDQRYLEIQGYIGPAIAMVFDSSGDAAIELTAETTLSGAFPLWRPQTIESFLTELKGQLELGAGYEIKGSSDSTQTGGTLKFSAQVALEAKTSLAFLGERNRLKDEITFTGAIKATKTVGKDKLDISGELSADDIVDLPAFENVFSLHSPKIAWARDRNDGKQSFAFSAKADVGRYKNVAEFEVKRTTKLKSATSDSTKTDDGETPPPGGVPTPFKQAELLAKQQEREKAAASKPDPNAPEWTASVKFAPAALAAIHPAELLMDLFNFAGNLELLPTGPELVSLGLSFAPDAPASMVVAGSMMLQETPTYFLASRLKSKEGSGLLLGVAPHEWSFREAFPEAEVPLLSELEISNVGLLIATEEFTSTSDDLYGEEYGFYRSLYGTDDFTVTIKPGLNLVAALPVEEMSPDSPLIPIMDKFGIERGPALLQGAIGTKIEDLYLRASLPPMSPPDAPAWFEYGQVDIELTGQPSIGLVGSIGVNIEDDLVVFFVKTKAGREGLILVGGMDAPDGWHEPFGIEWMTLNRTVLLLGLTPTGSVQMGFEGDLVVGESDVRVAVLAALNAATGVPTNFMFDGESEEGVAVADLVELQAAIAAARNGGDAEPIPTDKLPLLGVEDLELKFAPKDSPELNIERGLAIGGMLNIQKGPNQPPDLIAAAKFDVGEDGVIARAAVGDFEIGPVSLSDAAMDLTLTREDQYFRLSGAADLLIMQADVDVDVALTEMQFDAEGEAFGMFMADVHALGRADFTDPAFRVNGKLRNDFNEAVARDLLAQALAVANTEVERAQRARDAAVRAHTSAINARNGARAAWVRTPLFPRSAKNAARQRWGRAISVARYRGIERVARNAEFVAWTAVKAALEIASATESPIKIRSASFSGDLAKMKDGKVGQLAVVADVEGQEMNLSTAGFDFQDMVGGLRDIAGQAVRQMFRGRR